MTDIKIGDFMVGNNLAYHQQYKGCLCEVKDIGTVSGYAGNNYIADYNIYFVQWLDGGISFHREHELRTPTYHEAVNVIEMASRKCDDLLRCLGVKLKQE